MIEHKSTKTLPYVYMCINKETGGFYIGYRFANKVPSSDDLGKEYFTSNKMVRENFEQFDHFILAEFFNKTDAYKFESFMIKDTACALQINYQRIVKIKQADYKKKNKVTVVTEIKCCALPSCGKAHTNWRTKCCCLTHQHQYAGSKGGKKQHNAI